MTDAAPISELEFQQFQRFIYDAAGISMSSAKKALVSGRLASRLKVHNCASYGEYFRLVMSGGSEFQVAVDLLTTNETYFFREPKHFEFLRNTILPALPSGRAVRVWSAASSSGEEPYTLAMVLDDALRGRPWEVFGSDISTRVLERAQTGHYVMERGRDIPPDILSRYCLKGVGPNEGTFLVARELRNRVKFAQINLNQPLPSVGEFDVIFLRNVMIYFNVETKRQVVARLLGALRSGGYFIISHSESLNGINETLKVVKPSIYRKP
ncbi:MAG: protein-glutamate O-methyltransferase CheR [Pseudomonadota bacterium]